jgi:hypothetical protein
MSQSCGERQTKVAPQGVVLIAAMPIDRSKSGEKPVNSGQILDVVQSAGSGAPRGSDLAQSAGPVITRVRQEPAMSRLDVPAPRFGTLARFAYGFVKGHLESVAALSRLLRGAQRGSRELEEGLW